MADSSASDDAPDSAGPPNPPSWSTNDASEESPSMEPLADDAPAEESERSGDASASDPDPADELQQVRELIVGEHAREVDVRISRLEARIDDQLSTLRKRIADHEDAHRSDLEDLQEQVQELKQELADTRTKLAEALRQTREEFRDQLRKQEDELTQQMAEQEEELLATIDEAVDQIREQAADRRTLAALFEQVADHLRE